LRLSRQPRQQCTAARRSRVSHSSRTGHELGASGGTSASDISRVQACEASYDDLNPHEHAVIRAGWAECTDSLWAIVIIDDNMSI
jgi:hypothetical protein